MGRKTSTPLSPPSSAATDREPFDFEKDCFICGQTWEHKHKLGRLVSSEHLQPYVQTCINARDDDWARKINQRISSVSLKDVRARYHVACYNNFRFIPQGVRGRPKIIDLETAFANVCAFMEESDDCQFTMTELMQKMETYETSPRVLKQKLKNKYGDDILILERPGSSHIVCFRNTGYKILTDSWYQKKADTVAEERKRVVSEAAAIVLEDIRSRAYNTSTYPASGQLLNNVVDDIPETLLTFLNVVLLKGKKNVDEKLITKRDSIAHAIISAVRPRSFISPIQLATGVYLFRKFASRLLIGIVNSLGFCISYNNVSKKIDKCTLASDTSSDSADTLLEKFKSFLGQDIEETENNEDNDSSTHFQSSLFEEDLMIDVDSPSCSGVSLPKKPRLQ